MAGRSVATLRNLGPKSAAWLAEAGICDVDTLRSVGVAEAFRRVLAQGRRPSLNLAYALQAALDDCDWRQLDPARRSELVLMVDGLRDAQLATRIRCSWCNQDPLYVRYHDTEWGVPVHDDAKLFEFIVLEGAQAGLSWITILRKREGYRRAFADFDAQRIAGFGDDDVERLLADSGIVRNRAKIVATIGNARAFLELQARHGSFDRFMWQFVDGAPQVNHWQRLDEVPARTPASDALSAELRRHGFRFVGSTICYAHMQATGMVNDHLVSCFRHRELAAAGR